MAETPLVSIILPTYNGARYLKTAIDSCLGQTHSNIELIVVDGGSTDGTLTILQNYDDPRIVILHQENNVGRLPGALNLGLARVSGEFITWMQDDCIYAPTAIETLLDFLDRHPHVDFVYGDYWNIDENGEVLNKFIVEPPDKLMKQNYVGLYHLWRRHVSETIGGFDVSAFLVEDYEYWLRVAQKFQMVPYHPENGDQLYYYRLHQGALTSQPGVIHKRWRLHTVIKRQRFGLSWNQYRLEMAKIDIDEAFACYRDGVFSRVPLLGLKGIARNPAWLLNLGVISIIARSVLNTIKGRVSA